MRFFSRILKYQDSLFGGLFVLSVALVGFGGGAFVAEYRVFPYHMVREAAAGVVAVYKDITDTTNDSLLRRVSEFSTAEVPANRIRYPGALYSGLLWQGGDGLFRETCPDLGCLAVEYSSSGEVVHAYPYRFDQFGEWQKIVELPRGVVHPFQPPRLLQVPHAVRQYSNGDLLVIYSYRNSFPWKGGVARLDREGRPVWIRDDYSHHWPTLFEDPDGEELALVPGTTLEGVPVSSLIERRPPSTDITCEGFKNEVDHVRVLNGDGSVRQDIRIVDKIIDSPFASMLFLSTDPCDLLHLNYIDRIREDVDGILGVAPGDYVVSLRNISAFGIMDNVTGAVKKVVSGTFIHQHAVQHLRGSEFLIFDNHGADADAGPSRLLLIDLADGAVRERTIFPLANTPEEFRLFSHNRGNISISLDREKAIVVSSNEGIALEVQLSDGAILNVFRNIHDLSGMEHNLEGAGDRAVYLVLHDIQYVE